MLFAANFSAVSRPDHRIGVPYPVAYTLLFDSNAKRYGGFAAEAPARVVRAEEVHWHDRDFSVIGAAMLVNTDIPAYRVSYSVIAGTAAVSAAFLILLVGYLWRAQKRKAVSGAEQLIGSEAVVLNWKDGEGYVWAQGERWSARGDHHFASGQKLKIRRLDGLTPSAQASTWGQTHADVERAPNGKASQCVSIGRRCGVRFSPILRPEFEPPLIAAKFHAGMADTVAEAGAELARRQGCNAIVLCGGVFQNKLFLERVSEKVGAMGFKVLSPMPPSPAGNDKLSAPCVRGLLPHALCRRWLI